MTSVSCSFGFSRLFVLRSLRFLWLVSHSFSDIVSLLLLLLLLWLFAQGTSTLCVNVGHFQAIRSTSFDAAQTTRPMNKLSRKMKMTASNFVSRKITQLNWQREGSFLTLRRGLCWLSRPKPYIDSMTETRKTRCTGIHNFSLVFFFFDFPVDKRRQRLGFFLSQPDLNCFARFDHSQKDNIANYRCFNVHRGCIYVTLAVFIEQESVRRNQKRKVEIYFRWKKWLVGVWLRVWFAHPHRIYSRCFFLFE